MKLNHARADVFVPDGGDVEAALRRTTHLGIVGHPDDLEFGALHGILQCFGRAEQWFSGVTCTDGAGSPRGGAYARCTDEEMRRIRLDEQRRAAAVGRYAAVLQLGYTSAEAQGAGSARMEEDLLTVLRIAAPRVVYTHNPADKHATHVAVGMAAIRAMRRLPADRLPETVYGIESWRGLDWLPDSRKVILDVGGREHLAAALMGLYDSQIEGGKRYDSATLGRYRANATLLEAHATDQSRLASYAMDLTPLVRDRTLDVADYVTGLVEEFRASVRETIGRAMPGRA
jgi:LmbE family N-acetylglucosaminyl deacetylase